MITLRSEKWIGRSRHSCKVIVIVLWCAGMLLGTLSPVYAGKFSSLMRTCPMDRVTIVGLIMVPVFPFLLSAFAVYFSVSYLMFPVVFSKAFLFGASSLYLVECFGSAGFLMQLLIMFTDFFTLPALCWFWIRHADGSKSSFTSDVLRCLIWFIAAAILDCNVIVPMLGEIL